MSGPLLLLFQPDGLPTGLADGCGSAAIMSGSLTNHGGGHPITMGDGLLFPGSDGAGFRLQEGLFIGGPGLWVGFARLPMYHGFHWLPEKYTMVMVYMALTVSTLLGSISSRLTPEKLCIRTFMSKMLYPLFTLTRLSR